MTTVIFNKTNKIGDDVEHDVEDVARQFWASDDAKDWLANFGWPLERLALNWVPQHIGGWENHDDWEVIIEAIHAAMPR